MSLELRLRSGSDVITVRLSAPGSSRQRCGVDDQDCEVELVHAAQEFTVLIDGHPVRTLVARDGSDIAVAVDGVVHRFTPVTGADAAAPRSGRQGSGRVMAPMPGKVLNVLIQQGDHIEIGQPLVILEAMKMEHTLTAEVGGRVAAVHVKPGDMVDGAELLLEIASPRSTEGA